MPSVVVNFDVTIDASGTVEVFGQTQPTLEDIVVCEVELPATDLYNSATDAAFEFWEPSDDLGNISGARMSGWTKASSLRTDLNAIIDGNMDASGAVPFSTSSYLTTEQYYKHESFGRLALSMYAYYLFGHVAATAAITNDADFISKMNGNDENESGHALLAKRFADAIDTMGDAGVTEIVKQVLGQDAERAKDEDNNQLAPDEKQPLKFYAGDIIYLQVTLKKPTVTVTTGAVLAQQYQAQFAVENERTYALKITLS